MAELYIERPFPGTGLVPVGSRLEGAIERHVPGAGPIVARSRTPILDQLRADLARLHAEHAANLARISGQRS
jgi:hypothetical protein